MIKLVTQDGVLDVVTRIEDAVDYLSTAWDDMVDPPLLLTYKEGTKVVKSVQLPDGDSETIPSLADDPAFNIYSWLSQPNRSYEERLGERFIRAKVSPVKR